MRFLLIALAAIAWSGPARAAAIFYEAVDLEDTSPGEDLWRYRYALDPSPAAFLLGMGVAIEFDPALHASLGAPSAPDVSWDLLVLQPDLELQAPGIFDALVVDDPPGGVNGPFTVDFVWLGGAATPGSQPYSLYELDGDLVIVVATGTTQAAAPEPALAVLVISAAVGLAAGRRRS